VKKKQDYVPRPIRLADFLVVLAGFIHNITAAIHTFTDEILEIATYNAIRENQVNEAWEQFTEDLETMEDGNG
jgi:hypothetical protein